VLTLPGRLPDNGYCEVCCTAPDESFDYVFS
jgi:hypothetical protein